MLLKVKELATAVTLCIDFHALLVACCTTIHVASVSDVIFVTIRT